jgi:hypothetical protein
VLWLVRYIKFFVLLLLREWRVEIVRVGRGAESGGAEWRGERERAEREKGYCCYLC